MIRTFGLADSEGKINPQDLFRIEIKDLEEEILQKINNLGIGPGGLGGTTTALAVNVNTYPTHIAGLPVAINICCHVNRHIIREV